MSTKTLGPLDVHEITIEFGCPGTISVSVVAPATTEAVSHHGLTWIRTYRTPRELELRDPHDNLVSAQVHHGPENEPSYLVHTVNGQEFLQNDLKGQWKCKVKNTGVRSFGIPFTITHDVAYSGFVKTGLTAYWNGTSTGDGKVKELVAQNNGEIQGQLTAGKVGSGFSFDREECDHIKVSGIGEDWDADLEPGMSGFTVEAWVRPKEVEGGPEATYTIVHKGENTGLSPKDGERGWRLSLKPADGCALQYEAVGETGSPGTEAVQVRSKKQLVPGTWSHVAVVHYRSSITTVTYHIPEDISDPESEMIPLNLDWMSDDDNVRLYIDGEEVMLAEDPLTLKDLKNGRYPKTDLYIGATLGTVGCFHGEMDEIRIYKVPLSSEEILQNYLALCIEN